MYICISIYAYVYIYIYTHTYLCLHTQKLLCPRPSNSFPFRNSTTAPLTSSDLEVCGEISPGLLSHFSDRVRASQWRQPGAVWMSVSRVRRSSSSEDLLVGFIFVGPMDLWWMCLYKVVRIGKLSQFRSAMPNHFEGSSDFP